ncbi:MoaD/ThiS family protein [Cohnella yongneupensis]|uniref:MoaD/ThiS family protein n=1 Tax=Cohnella yongneupensis TaxID=425006 RepID=A0ABW0QWE8_9BACL
MIIEATVPGLLTDCTNGRARFAIEADTLQGAIDRLFSDYPLLKRHVYTETGGVRKHVMLCYNDRNVAWLDQLDIPLREGDMLHVMQLVSGG